MKPYLAQNWTVSPDGATYTFNLRSDVKFSDGNPFNSYNIWLQMYALYYLSGNSSSWFNSYNLFNLTNVTFGPATISLINSSGVISPSQPVITLMSNSSWPIYVKGPYQIVFHLKAPFLWLPEIMANQAGLVFDTEWVLTHGGFGTPTAYNSDFNQNPIPGSGPYVVSKVAEQAYVQVSQDPNYWGNKLQASDFVAEPLFDPGHIKTITVNYKADSLSRYVELTTGAAQISLVGFDNWKSVVNDSTYATLQLPSWAGAQFMLALDNALYPTNITLVRQAIVHAINISDINAKAWQGTLSPYIGPEYPYFKDFYNLGNFPAYSYNITLAKQLLAKANIASMPDFNFTIISGCTPCSLGAQIIKANLAQIGITVQIESLTSAQYFALFGSYSFNVQNAKNIGQLTFEYETFTPVATAPPDEWLAFVNCDALFNNLAAYCNPVVQNGVEAFERSSNITYIQSQLYPAQAQVYNDAPYLWIGLRSGSGADGGSLVWKASLVSSTFSLDPAWGGEDDLPILNTISYVS